MQAGPTTIPSGSGLPTGAFQCLLNAVGSNVTGTGTSGNGLGCFTASTAAKAASLPLAGKTAAPAAAKLPIPGPAATAATR